MATGTYRITEKRCATCRFWDAAERRVTFVKDKPAYVVCPVESCPCLAQRSKASRAVDHCVRWTLWEKLG